MADTVYHIKDNLSAPVEEAYRALNANIRFSWAEEPIKSLVITSWSPGEGKTTTTINLGVSMAKSGMKVLMVDADLRKPMLMKHLGGNSIVGLSNLISGRTTLEKAVACTSVNNFFFIPSGPKPTNPSEILSTIGFSDFIKQAEAAFDIVLIDTPPMESVIDSAIIASQAGATLIVIQNRVVNYKKALRLKEQLEKANARVIGVVLNKISKSEYKNYYGFYNYYGNVSKIDKGWFRKRKKTMA